MTLYKMCTGIVVILSVVCIVLMGGCEGSEAKKAITDTVREVVGGELLQKGEEAKKQINDVYDQMNEKIRQEFGQQFPSGSGSQAGAEDN
ncbi:MAG: hypothetical protein ACP5G0_01915 [Desulfomonilia bacterium]